MSAFYGYIFKINILDTEVKFHWSILLAFLYSAFYIKEPVLAISSFIISILIIVVHELGHVFFVNLFRYDLYSVVVHCLGGFCEHEDVYYDREDLWISLGGILAEFVLLILALVIFGFLVFIKIQLNYLAFFILIHELVFSNLFVMIFNLLPLRGFDGYTIFNFLRRRENLNPLANESTREYRRILSGKQIKKIAKHLINDSLKKAKKMAREKEQRKIT